MMRAIITYYDDMILSVNVINEPQAEAVVSELREAANSSEFEGEFKIVSYNVDAISDTLAYCFGENGK